MEEVMIRCMLVMLVYVASIYMSTHTAYAENIDSTDIAKPSKSADTIQADVKVQQQNKNQLKENEKRVMADAIIAVQETNNALIALDKDKKQDALNALEKAAGKLQLILARHPNLVLAPTKVDILTVNLVGDTEQIKKIRKEATNLLENGDVQAARHLLEGLASETVISVKSIPLGTYPDAIKKAVKLIDEGKQKEAVAVLQFALNTMSINNTIIPLPVVISQELLKNAEKLAEKKDRSEDENKHLANLLTDARKELQRAELLGYGNKKDFKNFYEQLDFIENKTNGGKSSSGLFSKIQEYLTDAVKTNQSNQSQDKVLVN